MQLRDYQLECRTAIKDKLSTHRSTLLSLFTGGGKTIIFADTIKQRLPGRAMVLANREELIFQACDKIKRTTGLNCAVEMANMVASTDLFTSTDVVVATIQTMISGKVKKRMERFNPEHFSTLIVDEAHFSISPTFKSVIKYFQRNPNLKVLGVTATPSRHDKEALGQIYESVAANYPMIYGIQNGWLCDITQQFIPVSSLDYSHIRTTAGDLNGADLASVMEEEENIAGVCQPSLEVAFALPPKTLSTIPVPDWGAYLKTLGRQARRCIVFTASVVQADMCAEIFNRVIPGLAVALNGKTQKDKRRGMLKNFSDGDVRMVMNCGVLTHGFDDPGVEVIIMARPTKSKSLYEQMIGRSTRPLPGTVDGPDLDTSEKRITSIANSAKPYCRIIDFVGNAGHHKLITTADVLGGKISEEAKAKAVKKAIDEGKPVKMSISLTNAEFELQTEKKKKNELEKRAYEDRKKKIVAKVDFSVQIIDPFDKLGITPASPYSHNFHRAPTPKMVAFLASKGINCEAQNICFSDAGKMIGKIRQIEENGPPTKGQIGYLKWQKQDISQFTKKTANEWITKHKEGKAA